MLKRFLVLLVALLSFAVTVVPATPAEAITSSETAELQRWLIAKGFLRDVADGRYGPKTGQAVMAFRKEIGAYRTTSWSNSLWDELRAYQQPYTRFSEPDRMEVNLTRQVAYLFRGGVLQGIFPIASGNGETYINSYGDPVRAYTPTGNYRFYLHRDPAETGGWHYSYLGGLYKPWFFSGGYAIHGSNSVPAYPASHGCVRFTTWDADWLQSRLYIGMPIHIWYEPAGAVRPVRAPDTIAVHRGRSLFEVWGAPRTGSSSFAFMYGNSGDIAFSGDWDGDGDGTVGVYRPSTQRVYLRNSNSDGVADVTFVVGDPGDIPVIGDFDGDGRDTVSVYRLKENRFYIFNRLGPNGGLIGVADYSFSYGERGDLPLAGDWNGNGVDTVGIYRPSTNELHLRNSNSPGPASLTYAYGERTDIRVHGDWDGDGDETFAAYRPSTGLLYVKNHHGAGPGEYSAVIGPAEGIIRIAR